MLAANVRLPLCQSSRAVAMEVKMLEFLKLTIRGEWSITFVSEESMPKAAKMPTLFTDKQI